MNETSVDILGDVLRALRLRGSVYFRAAFRAPWGMEMQAGEFANFHLVCRGECWLTTPKLPQALKLEAGDLVLCPRGDAHELRFAPDAPVVPAQDLIGTPKPDNDETIAFGGEGEATTSLICGHYEYQREIPHPLFEALPPVMHIVSSSADSMWRTGIAELASAMSDNLSSASGGAATVDRLAEALLISSINAYADSVEDRESFVAAIQDRHIGRALQMIHADIAREWNLAELADASAMSRSVFSERFRELVGVPPMVYIAKWRMIKAHNLLAETSLPIAKISEQVGYQSEFAFAKAFKRNLGLTPGEARKSVRV